MYIYYKYVCLILFFIYFYLRVVVVLEACDTNKFLVHANILGNKALSDFWLTSDFWALFAI